MKLLGSIKENITKKLKVVISVPQLEITEVILVHCNLSMCTYQLDSRVNCSCNKSC